jgi:predicted TIM-barrel fold metal-dependent hydrolase
MRISDAHAHFFSRDFYAALAREAAAARGGDPEGLLLELSRKSGLEIPDPDSGKHARRWLAELDRHGVRYAVSIASVPGEEEAVRSGAAASGGRLVPFLAVNAANEAGIRQGVRALAEGGFRGVILFPAASGVEVCDPSLDPLHAAAAGSGAIVAVHCGVLEIRARDLLGIRPRYDLRRASPLAVSAAAERHPAVRFLIPHFGSGLFRETLIAGAQSPNIYVDCSSSNSWMRIHDLTLEGVFRKALDVFGPRRILFGTDSSTFPRGYRADVLEATRRALDAVGIGAEEKARILGENLIEILGLGKE